MSIICTICARGGSKGLPGKNTRILMGKPLIAYSIEQALNSNLFEGVYVSTDCKIIANVAEKYGAIVPFLRPAELASDAAPKIPVIQNLVTHIEKKLTVEKIVDLDPTSPLRNIDDIEQALNLLRNDIDVVITGYLSNKNPYFNMIEKGLDGLAQLSKVSDKLFVSRQSSPQVYAMNASIYVWRRSGLNKGIWDNEKIAFYEMPQERSIDIDSYIDWKLVEVLIQEKADK